MSGTSTAATQKKRARPEMESTLAHSKQAKQSEHQQSRDSSSLVDAEEGEDVNRDENEALLAGHVEDHSMLSEQTKEEGERVKRPATGGPRSQPEKLRMIEQRMHQVFDRPLGLYAVTTKEEIGSSKTRTHVNPLSHKVAREVDLPEDWSAIYTDPKRPLIVDVGCAAGRFGLLMAKDAEKRGWGEMNYLGLEVRRPLVTRANHWAKAIGLKGNAYFWDASANTNLGRIAKSYPGNLSIVAVQFPDPHFKKKHHKRRVVNKEFLETLSETMPPHGVLYLSSDVEEAAAQMRDRATVSGFFERIREIDATKVLHGERHEVVPSGVNLSYETKNGNDTGNGNKSRGSGASDQVESSASSSSSSSSSSSLSSATAVAPAVAPAVSTPTSKLGPSKGFPYTPRDPVLCEETCAYGDSEKFWTREGMRAVGDGGDGAATATAAAKKDYGDWLTEPNPFGYPTEREVQNEVLGHPIYRAIFQVKRKETR